MKKTIVGILRGSALVLTIVTAAIVVASCYPNSPTEAEDFDVVATFFDQDADFGSLTTFSIPDSVYNVDISGADNIAMGHGNDADILDEIVAKLTARGYEQRDPDAERPDFVMMVARAATTEYDPYASDPWYSYWGNWFETSDSLPPVDVTWGLDFSWYSGAAVYSFDIGAVLLTLLDTRDTGNDATQDYPVLWMGTINGIVTGSDVALLNRVLAGIDKMFEQSPYIQHKQ